MVKEKFKEKGYLVFEDTYYNNKQRLSCIDADGYKYQISYNQLMKENFKTAKFHYGNKYTLENIQKYLNNHVIELKVKNITYDNIKVKTDKIEFVCKCGDTFKSTF